MHEFYSRDGNSVNKVIRGVRVLISVGVGVCVGWGINKCFVDSAYRIKFSNNESSKIYSSYYSFHSLDAVKFVGSFLDEPLEYNNITLLNSSDIEKTFNTGAKWNITKTELRMAKLMEYYWYKDTELYWMCGYCLYMLK